jgi:hypothetical protein
MLLPNNIESITYCAYVLRVVPITSYERSSTDAGVAGVHHRPHNDAARCFRAQATVEQGRIARQWSGREPGVTMMLSGVMSVTGDVRM